jgi:hypothetical protein
LFQDTKARRALSRNKFGMTIGRKDDNREEIDARSG